MSVNGIYEALGRGVVRFRWVVLAVWLVGTIAAVHFLPSIGSEVNNNNSAFLPASAPSNQAATLAQPLIGSTNNSQVQVVAATNGAALGASDQAALTSLSSELKTVPTVDAVTFLGASPDGKAAQLLVVSSVSPLYQTGAKTLIDDLNGAIDKSALPSDLSVHLAGSVATNVANQEASSKAGNQTQLLSLLFIIVLLFIIFRSVLAPILTLLPAAVVLQLSGAFIGGLGSVGLKISSITQLLLIVLILGAGTDYGLFLVFRVREEIQRGRTPHEAVAVSVLRVGESITASAATVIVALLTLTLASFGIYHDLGVPLAVGIFVMLLAGLTLLPALLAIFGRAVFWPSKAIHSEMKEGLWGRVAGRLVRRPVMTLVVGVVVFGALAFAALGFKPGGFGGATTAPVGSSIAAGNAAVSAHFPQAAANPTNLVLRFGSSQFDNATNLATTESKLHETGDFTTIAGPLNPNGENISPAEFEALHAALGPAQALPATPPTGAPATIGPDAVPLTDQLYNAYRASARYISADGMTVQYEVGLKAGDPSSTAAINAVPGIRQDFAHVARSVGATASGVAGEAPALYDVSNISDGDLRHIVPIAVLAIGLVLALVLRSLIAPLYLIASVVLSYLASLGLAVIVFIYIGGQAGITFLLPFLMFIFLLALGEDYNILVMTRIREEAAQRPLREAVIRAVGATGPTVTSAGLVLAGTFAVLAISGRNGPGSSQIEAIGFGLAVGILLDTFVVRTVLVPSTVALLGRWNWWPSAMGRRHPDEPPRSPLHAKAEDEKSPIAVAGEGNRP